MERENGRNVKERKTMLACMDFIARNLNDEEILIDRWFACGVPDGDLDYWKLVSDFNEERENVDDYCIEEEPFEEIMTCFLHCMYKAYLDKSGLYCDSCLSRE